MMASTAPAPPTRTDSARRRAAPAGSMRSPTPLQLVVALTVLGAILRFATLDVSSIELDESATLILVHRGFSGMLSHLTSSESAPPLYYMLAWAWTKVFGAGAVGFRSMSALVGTATIPVMYLAGREISPRVGVWAATLTTLSPTVFFFAQEARTYVLLIFFSAAAFVMWQRTLREPSARRLGLWALFSSLAVLAHYFAGFLFLSESLLLFRRVGWRRVWPAAGAVALVGLALVPLAISQRGDGKTNWIEELTLPRRIVESAKMFTVGYYGPLVLFALAIAAAIVAGAVALVLRYGDARERDGARDAAIAAGAIALPLVLALTHVVDVYDGRNMFAFWVPFAVLVSVGLGSERAKRTGTSLGLALCAIYAVMVAAMLIVPDYERDNWRGLSHALARPTTARLIVGLAHAAPPLSIYMGKLVPVEGRAPGVREIDFVALRHLRTVGPPQAPVVPSQAPPGFQPAGTTRTETFAIARFRADTAQAPSLAQLQRESGLPGAEVILQR